MKITDGEIKTRHIFSALLTVATVLGSFFGYSFFEPLINSWPAWFIILIIIILITPTYILFPYWLDTRKKREKLPEHLGNNFKGHPILVVDNDGNALKKMKNCLEGYGYDVTRSRDLSDYRIAERYAIVVSDIEGVGPVADAIAVLNTIMEVYPYKVVIPVSIKPEWPGLNSRIISKAHNEHLKELPKLIGDNMKKLNSPASWWKIIEGKLEENKVPTKDQEMFRQDYINFLKRLTKEEE